MFWSAICLTTFSRPILFVFQFFLHRRVATSFSLRCTTAFRVVPTCSTCVVTNLRKTKKTKNTNANYNSFTNDCRFRHGKWRMKTLFSSYDSGSPLICTKAASRNESISLFCWVSNLCSDTRKSNVLPWNGQGKGKHARSSYALNCQQQLALFSAEQCPLNHSRTTNELGYLKAGATLCKSLSYVPVFNYTHPLDIQSTEPSVLEVSQIAIWVGNRLPILLLLPNNVHQFQLSPW